MNVELFEKQIVEELRRENACLLEQGGMLIKSLRCLTYLEAGRLTSA